MRMARAAKEWTIAELHRLPDDGNTYELVRGALFVTPPPSVAHEDLVSALIRRLVPYVDRCGVGRVYTPHAVVQAEQSQVEPDIMVRPVAGRALRWSDLPLPILVVEILSGSTRRRDLGPKRDFYVDLGIPEYWIVNGHQRAIHVVRRGRPDVIETSSVTWHPSAAAEPLVMDVAQYFGEALGDADATQSFYR